VNSTLIYLLSSIFLGCLFVSWAGRSYLNFTYQSHRNHFVAIVNLVRTLFQLQIFFKVAESRKSLSYMHRLLVKFFKKQV
jgi:hypothetical protein